MDIAYDALRRIANTMPAWLLAHCRELAGKPIGSGPREAVIAHYVTDMATTGCQLYEVLPLLFHLWASPSEATFTARSVGAARSILRSYRVPLTAAAEHALDSAADAGEVISDVLDAARAIYPTSGFFPFLSQRTAIAAAEDDVTMHDPATELAPASTAVAVTPS